jgi:aspartate/methionine/tyrosine aminotransferase
MDRAPAPQFRVSDRFASFGTTIFTEMTLLAQKHSAVNLAQGFPDFDGPDFVKKAAADAMASGQNQYARMFGIPVLNTAIAARWKLETGETIDPDKQVTVTSGCTEALAAAVIGLINPGDEVILFEPYYDSYRACVAMAGGVARFVTLRAPDDQHSDANGFWFDHVQLKAAFTPRTRAILVNTPHNPTGKVFTRAELQLIADLCTKHGVIAITDEVYERLVYEPDRPHIHLATLPGMAELTVTLTSLGKTFSLTGWKVGWAVATPDLSTAVRAAHQFLTFATSTPFQHGAAAAMAFGEPTNTYITELVAHLRWGREFLGGALSRLGFRVFQPAGAYFIVADWTHGPGGRGMGGGGGFSDDIDFCKRLTAEAGVAAIPPSVFYENKAHGKPLARFAFCKKRETLEEAVRRLDRWAQGNAREQ